MSLSFLPKPGSSNRGGFARLTDFHPVLGVDKARYEAEYRFFELLVNMVNAENAENVVNVVNIIKA